MHIFIKSIALCGVFVIAGCSVVSSEIKNHHTVYPMEGTNTAVVGIGVDKSGVPFVAAKEIIVAPGQKVLFAGPDEFVVTFKNKKSPNRKIDNPSRGGVVKIEVPSEVFEQGEFVEEYRKNGQLKFNYGVIVNGKELDPEIIVRKK
ncbi:hypothetical protein [Cellvibrio sp. QJXJ]|uniref:hypothetical protein n=1 Tax=Cellvibrio sp. QJXJ TaxID=2964606 RepID=UPI0021C2D4D5|nr:hypothetical protein [Cellvibrio sp. QJXJ]UUA70930.1 hypothetical protein NNX04_10895 [Cellvibrio sp. QJXJ]